MSAFAGPEIVNTGLVLSLDAGNTRSYPGSGTTWTDLAAARTGTLTNGPTFSSSNGGSIVFDGVNDFTDFGDVLDLGTNDMTINVWLRPTTLTAATYYAIVSKSLSFTQTFRWAVGFYGNNTWTFMTGNPDVGGVTPFGTTAINTNTWYMMTYVFTRSSSITVYINGVQDTLSGSASISAWNGQDFNNSVPFRVGAYTAADNSGTNSNLPGNISNVQIYFRSLSAAEIRQNFYALRGRYGI